MSVFFNSAAQNFGSTAVDAYSAALYIAYKFEENGGTRFDSHTGSYMPDISEQYVTIPRATGKDGYGIDYDNIPTRNGGLISSEGYSFSNKTIVSIAAWVKLDTLPATSDIPIIEDYKDGGAQVYRCTFRINSSGNLYIAMSDSSGLKSTTLTFAAPVTAGVWVFVGCVIDTTTNTISGWVNSEKQTATVAMNTFYNGKSTYGTAMGDARDRPAWLGEGLNGIEDELNVWRNVALSDAAMNELGIAPPAGLSKVVCGKIKDELLGNATITAAVSNRVFCVRNLNYVPEQAQFPCITVYPGLERHTHLSESDTSADIQAVAEFGISAWQDILSEDFRTESLMGDGGTAQKGAMEIARDSMSVLDNNNLVDEAYHSIVTDELAAQDFNIGDPAEGYNVARRGFTYQVSAIGVY